MSIYNIWCTTHKKGPYAFWGQCRSRSPCASMQSNMDTFCSSTNTTVSTDSVRGQQRPRSACTYVQADQGLRCPQIVQGPFSCVVHHVFMELWCQCCTLNAGQDWKMDNLLFFFFFAILQHMYNLKFSLLKNPGNDFYEICQIHVYSIYL